MTELTEQTVQEKKKRKPIAIRMPKGYDRWIHFSMIFLLLFGLIMIASASMGLAVGDSGYLLRTVVKQIIFSIGGYVAMLYVSNKFNISLLKGGAIPNLAMLMAFALLVCLAFPATGGARAWIRLPLPGIEISIQPSEFAKIMSILIVAAYCGDIQKEYPRDAQLLRRPFGFLFAYLVIIMFIQSDFGSAVVLFLISAACFLIPNHRNLRKSQKIIKWLLVVGVVGVAFLLSPWGEGVIRLLPLKDYQINRILSAVNPFADQYNTGYQLINGLVSFATGGWFGLGFGNSVRKYTSFPAANTDFILAIIVEELGFVGFLMVFIPYVILIVRLFQYALKIRSEKAKIILVGTAMYLLVHLVFNVGGVTGLIPLTGVPLLMISAGGSSTLAMMTCVGLAQSVISQYHKGLIE